MKFLFSIMIVMCHLPGLPSMFGVPQFQSPALAVEFFFIVSGFLMARSGSSELSTGKATLSFILKKYLIVFPVYLFAYILSITVMSLSRGCSVAATARMFFGSVYELLLLENAGLHSFEYYELIVGNGWYLSAMLLAMFLLYPLLHSKRDVFLNVIAPLLAIFILGYLFMEEGTIKFEKGWNGLFCRGMLRAICDISIGCICCNVHEKIRSIAFTRLAKILFTIVEFALYAAAMYGMAVIDYGNWDFFVVLILAIAITISFSKCSYSGYIFRAQIFPWLGKFSLSIYLLHGIWIRLFKDLKMPLSLSEELILVLLLTASSALVCTFLIDLIKGLWKEYGNRIKKYFIEA